MRYIDTYFGKEINVELKGYVTQSGYMGLVDGEYELFSTEEEYKDYVISNEKLTIWYNRPEVKKAQEEMKRKVGY